jgi:uncharacterized protein
MTTRPVPVPDEDSAPFWAGLREERLVAQACEGCGRVRFPPMGRCPWCRDPRARWEELSGAATVYSWTVVRRALDPAFADDVPYAVATVDLVEGPRLAVRAEPAEALAFDAPVHAVFVHHEGWTELRVVPDA